VPLLTSRNLATHNRGRKILLWVRWGPEIRMAVLAKASSTLPRNGNQLTELNSLAWSGDDVFDMFDTYAWPSMCGCCMLTTAKTKHDRLIIIFLVLRCMTPGNYLPPLAVPFTRLPPAWWLLFYRKRGFFNPRGMRWKAGSVLPT
jgi:hypothetical protein